MEETLVADCRVIDVWAREGNDCGRTRAEGARTKEPREAEHCLLLSSVCQAPPGTAGGFPRWASLPGHRRRLCSLPEDPFTY